MAERSRTRAGSLAIGLAILGLLAVTVLTLLTAVHPAPNRVQELAQQLRCPVCKSVSIAESPADTATAMRQVVAEQVAAGRSDTEILGYFRARYGDWVLLDPPARGATLALWLVPLGTAAVGAALVAARVRRSGEARSTQPTTELSEPARARLDAAVTRARATPLDGQDGP